VRATIRSVWRPRLASHFDFVQQLERVRESSDHLPDKFSRGTSSRLIPVILINSQRATHAYPAANALECLHAPPTYQSSACRYFLLYVGVNGWRTAR